MQLHLYTQKAMITKEQFQIYTVVGTMRINPEIDRVIPEGQYIHADIPFSCWELSEEVGKEHRGKGLSGVLVDTKWYFKERMPQKSLITHLYQSVGIPAVYGEH